MGKRSTIRISLCKCATTLLILLLAAWQVPAEPDSDKSSPGPDDSNALTDAVTNAPAETTLQTNLPSSFPARRSLRPPLDPLPSTNVVAGSNKDKNEEFQVRIKIARQQRREQLFSEAEKNLRFVLDSNSSDEMNRSALLELAQLTREKGELMRAQQLYAQFLNRFPDDANVPEVYLRQGIIYRELGAHTLALAKFYSVMSTALNPKLEWLDYYKGVVLQAQTEIADTYYLQGKYGDAANFYERLLYDGDPNLNEQVVLYKLVRCLSAMERHNETVAKGEQFLTTPQYASAPEVPEIRFLVAMSLKELGRSQDALKQVLILLKAQQKVATTDRPTWRYWQQRAGNEIANQLYLEKDYLNAVSVYTCLASLNDDPAWQLPVFYQIGLGYEQLQQPAKANEYYDLVIAGQKDLSKETPSESLSAVIKMAKWRKSNLAWQAKAEAIDRDLSPSKATALP